MKKILKDLLFIAITLLVIGLALNIIMHTITVLMNKDYPLELYLLSLLTSITMPPIVKFLLIPFLDWLHNTWEF